MQAMIFAAGLGTRLRPLTDQRPKALVEVNGKPLLEHVILKLKQSGCDRIVVNVHHFGEQIIQFLEANRNFGLDIRISDERSLLLNTGGGIKRALPLLRPDEPVLIHNVDVACDIDLKDFYSMALSQLDKREAWLVTRVRQTARYLLFDDDRLLRGWIHLKPEGNVERIMSQDDADSLHRSAFSGIHIIAPALFQTLADCPGEVFSIVDFYLSACMRHPIMRCDLPADCRWVDCGRVESLQEAAKILPQDA